MGNLGILFVADAYQKRCNVTEDLENRGIRERTTDSESWISRDLVDSVTPMGCNALFCLSVTARVVGVCLRLAE
jgi:hypothetical protein